MKEYLTCAKLELSQRFGRVFGQRSQCCRQTFLKGNCGSFKPSLNPQFLVFQPKFLWNSTLLYLLQIFRKMTLFYQTPIVVVRKSRIACYFLKMFLFQMCNLLPSAVTKYLSLGILPHLAHISPGLFSKFGLKKGSQANLSKTQKRCLSKFWKFESECKCWYSSIIFTFLT